MDHEEEIGAYSLAAASDHLDRLDTECVQAIVGMQARPRWWLDAGCGPGQIACKTAHRTAARILGVDRAFGMLQRARDRARAEGLELRAFFVQADAAALPFREAAFDLVYSNSVLHHLILPENYFLEAARVTGSGGKFFLRDLARPVRWRMRRHLSFHGRHYAGQMRQLFEASVRAAYTPVEAKRLGRAAGFRDVRVQRQGALYLTIRSN
jgi:ubiquinone/menaquinone biosynthesis C-methylase UbiE